MRVITTTSSQRRKPRLTFHANRILRAAVFGVVFFIVTVMARPLFEQTLTGTTTPLTLSVKDIDTSIDNEKILTMINDIRNAADKPPLIVKEELCASAHTALDRVRNNQPLGEFIELCPACAHLTLLSLQGTYDEQTLIEKLRETNTPQLVSDDISTCIQSASTTLVIGIGTLNTQIPNSQRVKEAPPSPTARTISDTEVFEALNQYRASHLVPQLVTNEQLCRYAQKRVGDLVAFGGLDQHAGFKQDFEGAAFPPELTGYTGGGIGENLAHQNCYRGEKNVVAETGAALIEWCFDSSTAGHREAQLNPRYTAACVRHAQQMYVVIFGE